MKVRGGRLVFWAFVALVDIGLSALLAGWGGRAAWAGEFTFRYHIGSKRGITRTIRHQFEGADARRIGVGLVALAGMTLAWAFVLSVPGRSRWTPLHRAGAAAALACLLVGAVLIMPPWRLLRPTVAAFYAGPVYLWLVWRGVRRLRLRDGTPGVMIASIFAFPFTAMVLPDDPGLALVAGLMFSIVLALHTAFLWPGIREDLARQLFG